MTRWFVCLIITKQLPAHCFNRLCHLWNTHPLWKVWTCKHCNGRCVANGILIYQLNWNTHSLNVIQSVHSWVLLSNRNNIGWDIWQWTNTDFRDHSFRWYKDSDWKSPVLMYIIQAWQIDSKDMMYLEHKYCTLNFKCCR